MRKHRYDRNYIRRTSTEKLLRDLRKSQSRANSRIYRMKKRGYSVYNPDSYGLNKNQRFTLSRREITNKDGSINRTKVIQKLIKSEAFNESKLNSLTEIRRLRNIAEKFGIRNERDFKDYLNKRSEAFKRRDRILRENRMMSEEDYNSDRVLRELSVAILKGDDIWDYYEKEIEADLRESNMLKQLREEEHLKNVQSFEEAKRKLSRLW